MDRERVEVPTYVVIPVKDQLELTQRIVAQLQAQGATKAIIVFDNGSTDGTAAWLQHVSGCSGVEFVDAADLTLHQMWNRGVAMARARDAVCNVAILNNDLVLGPDFCPSLASALRTDPELWAVSPVYDARAIGGVQYVESTFKNQGLAGFAFMVRGEAFDEVVLRRGPAVVVRRRRLRRADSRVGPQGGNHGCDLRRAHQRRQSDDDLYARSRLRPRTRPAPHARQVGSRLGVSCVRRRPVPRHGGRVG